MTSTSLASAAAAPLERYVEALRAQWLLPGCAVAVTGADATLLALHLGHADLDTRTPVTPSTAFEIGSISKSITSLAVLGLAEDGALSLDDAVTRHLPWFEVGSRHGPITVRSLLNHTSGLIAGSDALPDHLAQIWALRETQTGSPPGSFFHYSNVGYQLLGAIVEQVTGRPASDVVAERVLVPAGMTASTARITHDFRSRLATGYEPLHDDRPFLPGDPPRPATWFEIEAADGNVATPLEDMARYARLLLRRGAADGGRVVSERSFALLLETVAPEGEPPWPDSRYGLGLNVARVDGHEYVDHGGGMVGYCSHLVADLTAGLAAVVLTNAPGDSPVAVQIARAAIALARAATEGRELPAPPQADRRSLPDAEQLVGTYGEGEARIEVRPSPAGLVLESADGGGALYDAGGGRLASDHPRWRQFHHRCLRDGGARWWVCGPEALPEAGAAPAAEPAPPPGSEAYVGHYRSFTPWFTSFRIVVRRGRLHLVAAQGTEAAQDDPELVPLGEATFRVGSDPRLPERIVFGPVVDGRCISVDLDGCRYSRSFVP